MNTTETKTTTTALEVSSSYDTKKKNLLMKSSSFFYDHEYDAALERFYQKKKSASFYDRNRDHDLFRFWKKHRSQLMKRSSLERLHLLKTECGYSPTEIKEVVGEVEKIRNQQQRFKTKKTTTLRRRERGRRVEYKDSARAFFLTKYNQKARMVINRAVHAPLMII